MAGEADRRMHTASDRRDTRQLQRPDRATEHEPPPGASPLCRDSVQRYPVHQRQVAILQEETVQLTPRHRVDSLSLWTHILRNGSADAISLEMHLI